MAKPIKRQAWSKMDVFGLLNGISIWDKQYKTLKYVRKPFDTNLDTRSKIFKYHDYPVDVTKQGLINALSHEFDFVPYNVTTKKVFELSYKPTVIGEALTQDVYAYYKKIDSNEWVSIPQVWSTDYLDAKKQKSGFIVWAREKVVSIDNVKNFTYSNIVEICNDLPDKSELKFIYSITDYDVEGNRILVKFTDINNPNDKNDVRFTFRIENRNPSLSGLIAYTLDDIPDNVSSNLYYDQDNKPKEMLYTIREHFDKHFKHKWGQITDRECIWDIHKLYGSGHISHFYDAEVPDNSSFKSKSFNGYLGGVDELSDSLYTSELVETNSPTNQWYLNIYPGKFYIDGVPFYYFEQPNKVDITFTNNSANIPSGLSRGMYSILALSGYYSSTPEDPCLVNVYEDYNYQIGEDGNVCWTHIYRRRPYISQLNDHAISLKEGEYHIDFENNKIYANNVNKATLIWDSALEPSGTLLTYDLNPLNEQNLTFEKFFLFLSLNRT